MRSTAPRPYRRHLPDSRKRAVPEDATAGEVGRALFRRKEDAELAAKLDARRAADAAKVLEKDAALQAELNG